MENLRLTARMLVLLPALLLIVPVVLVSFLLAIIVQIVWVCILLAPIIAGAFGAGIWCGATGKDVVLDKGQQALVQRIIFWPLFIEIEFTQNFGRRLARKLSSIPGLVVRTSK